MVKDRSVTEQSRVSGLLGMLDITESTVAKAWLEGRNPAMALATMRGKEKPTAVEDRDVRKCMASERVRRTIAGVTRSRGVSAEEVRAYVFERLIAESDDPLEGGAKEGGTRIAALKMLGELPGVDMWKPQDDRDQSLAEAGVALGEALAALEDRLSSEVVEANMVQPEPNGEDGSLAQEHQPALAADDDDMSWLFGSARPGG